MSKAKKPLIGYAVLEDWTVDMSDWSGQITYPDPTGANLYWQNPMKMIEYSAYDQLQAKLDEAVKAKEAAINLYKETEGLASTLSARMEQMREKIDILKRDYGTCCADRDTLKIENQRLIKAFEMLHDECDSVWVKDFARSILRTK